jgi:hypothetical protein
LRYPTISVERQDDIRSLPRIREAAVARPIPQTTAKAKQQALSLHGSVAWLYDDLQEGSISSEQLQDGGMNIDTDRAYMCYVEFSKCQRD